MPTPATHTQDRPRRASRTGAGNQRRLTPSAEAVDAKLGGVLVGYARVSTAEQNPAHQADALTRAGVAPADIRTDIASGAKASRPQLDLVLRLLRDGDTLVITRLDRLGRSLLHLVILGAQLRDRGVGLQVIEQGNDTSTAEGRAMFGMLSVLAELQRELIVANTRDGLAAARARAGSAVASPSSPRSRRRSPSSSTTPEARPSPRSPPCSVSPGPPSTATSPSTRSTPRRAVRRRHRSPLTRRGGRRHGRLPRRPRPLRDPNVCDPSPPRLPGRHPSGRPAQSQTPSPSPASSPPPPPCRAPVVRRRQPQSICSARPGP